MSLDPTWLFMSLIPERHRIRPVRVRQKTRPMAAELLLMVYPYFATSPVSLVATGAVIGFMLWYAIRLGW